MRKLCLIIFFLLTIKASRADELPRLETVISHFYSNYEFKENHSFLKFAKRKEGWTVYEHEYQSNKAVNEQWFWSLKTKSFLPLKYKVKKTVLSSHELERRVYLYSQGGGSAYDYNRTRYYGYDGWDRDMLRDFLYLIENSSDTALESLQKACLSYAYNFIENKYKVSNKSSFPVSPDSFSFYINLSIQAIQRIREINPFYQFRVGGPQNKIANVHMHAWSVLAMAGYPDKAKAYLTKDLYDPNMLRTARNYLSGLSENAILFTNKDNGTNPLWYLQKTEKFRNDVRVIYYPMLNQPEYIRYLRNEYGLKFTLDSIWYDSESSSLIVYDYKPAQDTVSAADFFIRLKQSIGQPEPATRRVSYKPSLVKFKVLAGSPDNSEIWFDLTKRRFIYRDDLAMMDLLFSGGEQSSVNFASTFENDLTDMLKGYLLYSGLTYRLESGGPKYVTVVSAGKQEIAITRFLDNKFQPLDYTDSSIRQNYSALTTIQSNYHQIYFSLFNYYKDRNDTVSLKACLRRWRTDLPAVKSLISHADVIVGYAIMLAEPNNLDTYLDNLYLLFNQRYMEDRNKDARENLKYSTKSMASLLDENGFKSKADKFRKLYPHLF